MPYWTDYRSVKYVSELGTEILFNAQRLKASWDIRNHHYDSQTTANSILLHNRAICRCNKHMQRQKVVGSAATACVNPHCDSLGVGQIRLGRHQRPIISHSNKATKQARCRQVKALERDLPLGDAQHQRTRVYAEYSSRLVWGCASLLRDCYCPAEIALGGGYDGYQNPSNVIGYGQGFSGLGIHQKLLPGSCCSWPLVCFHFHVFLFYHPLLTTLLLRSYTPKTSHDIRQGTGNVHALGNHRATSPVSLFSLFRFWTPQPFASELCTQ